MGTQPLETTSGKKEDKEDGAEFESGEITLGKGVLHPRVDLRHNRSIFVSVALNILGMLFGMFGYALGSRILGGVASFLARIIIFIGVYFGQLSSQF